MVGPAAERGEGINEDMLENYLLEDTTRTLGRIGQRSYALGMAAGFFPGGDRTDPFGRPGQVQSARDVSDSPEPLDPEGVAGRAPSKRNKGKAKAKPVFQTVSDDEDSTSRQEDDDEDARSGGSDN
jgi:hypothetical protein